MTIKQNGFPPIEPFRKVFTDGDYHIFQIMSVDGLIIEGIEMVNCLKGEQVYRHELRNGIKDFFSVRSLDTDGTWVWRATFTAIYGGRLINEMKGKKNSLVSKKAMEVIRSYAVLNKMNIVDSLPIHYTRRISSGILFTGDVGGLCTNSFEQLRNRILRNDQD